MLLCVRAGGAVLQLLVLLYVAVKLSLHDMGLFTLFVATMGILRALGTLGVDQVSTKRLSIAKRNGDEDEIREISLAGLLIVGGFSAVLLPLAFAVVTLFPVLDAYSWDQKVAFFLAAPAFVLIGLMIGQLRGLDRNLIAQAPDALGVYGITFLILFVLDSRSEAITLSQTMYAMLTASIGVVLVQLTARLKVSRLGGALPSRQKIVDLWHDAWGVFQAHVVTVSSVYAPTFITMAFLGPSMLAILEVARRFGELFTMLTTSLGATYSPSYARLAFQNDISQLNKIMRDAGLLGGGAALLYALGILFFGSYVITAAFPDDYLLAVGPMTIIALGTAVNAFFSPISTMYLMSGSAKLVRKWSFLALISVVLSAIALGSVWDVTGVAIAVLLGRLVRDLGLFCVYART